MQVIDIGLTKYEVCYRLQKDILDGVKAGKLNEHLVITEHEPVVTIGRIGSRKNLLVSEEFLRERNIDVIEVDRGGDITYHGPGQIVLYPIIDLKKHAKDIHKYLRALEDMVIALLQDNGIGAFRIKAKTGVWTKEGKIASVGIGISRWVTFHGLALNVDCDLTPFGWINSCGFKNINITSMEKLIGADIDKTHIKRSFINLFCERYENIPTMA